MASAAGTLLVDVAALVGLEHECVGCADPGECCCAQFEVCVSEAELATVEGLLKRASRYCPDLKAADGYENVFDPVDEDLYSIDTDEEGLCVLAYLSRQGVRCSLHSAVLDLGLDPTRVKPVACVLWPLAVSEGPPRVLTVHEDTMAFPCNRPRTRGQAGLCPGVAEIVDGVFGRETRERIEWAAAQRRRKVELPLHGRLAAEP